MVHAVFVILCVPAFELEVEVLGGDFVGFGAEMLLLVMEYGVGGSGGAIIRIMMRTSLDSLTMRSGIGWRRGRVA